MNFPIQKLIDAGYRAILFNSILEVSIDHVDDAQSITDYVIPYLTNKALKQLKIHAPENTIVLYLVSNNEIEFKSLDNDKKILN